MSYFNTATQDLNVTNGFLELVKRLFRKADAAWIVLTDWGYELQVLGELISTSPSLEEALEELDAALIHSYAIGLHDGPEVLNLGDGVWGVDMADLTRRARQALESL